MIAALRHTDLCSLAMPTNGEQRQGEREPFIITQERRGKCCAGKGEENTGIMLPVASRIPHRECSPAVVLLNFCLLVDIRKVFPQIGNINYLFTVVKSLYEVRWLSLMQSFW